MTLTPVETLITIGIVTLGTMMTRFLPFLLFKGADAKNSYINYLGRVLPYASIGLLVVYCLKDVNLKSPAYGASEAIAIFCTAASYYWKENTLLSIGAGTIIYMLLVRL